MRLRRPPGCALEGVFGVRVVFAAEREHDVRAAHVLEQLAAAGEVEVDTSARRMASRSVAASVAARTSRAANGFATPNSSAYRLTVRTETPCSRAMAAETSRGGGLQ
jgi:hypothetical protein